MVISLFYHKQGFHVARAETPPRERDLASDLGIAKMHHRQKFGFTISDWFRPRYEPNVCLLLKHRETQSHGYFFFFSRMAGRTGAPSDYFSRTLEKLGRTCDQIGHTLEPCHTAKSTKSWSNDNGVGVLDWPANSPDLNPIENI